jgi:hypothetical protein
MLVPRVVMSVVVSTIVSVLTSVGVCRVVVLVLTIHGHGRFAPPRIWPTVSKELPRRSVRRRGVVVCFGGRGLVVRSGDKTPCRMATVTLHSHVRYKEIQARTCYGPLFSSVRPY